MSKDNHLQQSLTPQESIALRQMVFHVNAAEAVLARMTHDLTEFVRTLLKGRNLEQGKWQVAETLDGFVSTEKPQVQIAEPGQIASVAKDANVANKLHVAGS